MLQILYNFIDSRKYYFQSLLDMHDYSYSERARFVSGTIISSFINSSSYDDKRKLAYYLFALVFQKNYKCLQIAIST